MHQHNSYQRACGKRLAAGVYAETRLSDQGQPIETFILDPPVPVDPTALGLTAVGPQLIEIDGVWHIFDIVGRTYYPYVADMVEEVRRKGASRRLPRTLDLAKLSAESSLVLIHAKAVIENYEGYPQPPAMMCPHLKHLSQLEEVCAGLWWHDISESDLDRGEMGFHHRSIPGGVSYRTHPRPGRKTGGSCLPGCQPEQSTHVHGGGIICNPSQFPKSLATKTPSPRKPWSDRWVTRAF